MQVRRRIERKLREALSPSHLEIVDESHRHAVEPGAESHFRVLVVSDAFADRSALERHRMVYDCLAEEMSGPVHALGLETLTPEERAGRQDGVGDSPPCLGGEEA